MSDLSDLLEIPWYGWVFIMLLIPVFLVTTLLFLVCYLPFQGVKWVMSRT